MALETTRFDPMSHLDPGDHLDLLNDAFATQDARVVARVLDRVARSRGVSSLTSEVIPTIGTVMAVLDELKLELRVQQVTAV